MEVVGWILVAAVVTYYFLWLGNAAPPNRPRYGG